jgi:hypothetical protein
LDVAGQRSSGLATRKLSALLRGCRYAQGDVIVGPNGLSVDDGSHGTTAESLGLGVRDSGLASELDLSWRTSGEF